MSVNSGLGPVNGIELGYQVFGEGHPLILLHGGIGSVEMLGPNVDAPRGWPSGNRFDVQRHGRSPAADRPIRFETMADDIAALMRHLGLEKGGRPG
jgi:pimeloyl-ACP methyl ester carboxylesterase